jgi:hypothetical protein
MSSFGLSGQLNYKAGYIISLKNDTIFGQINDGGGIRNSKVCLFKANNKSKTIRYYPDEIKSYRYINGKYYDAKKIFFKDDYRSVFTDVLLKGEINLYYFRKNKEMEYYIEKEDGNLIGLINKEVPVRPRSYIYYNEFNAVYISIYKDTLYSVFSDCEKVQNQLGKVDYTHKSLVNITKEYLNETCKESDCITYEKNFNSQKPGFGVFSGIQLSKIAWSPKIKSNFLTSVPIGLLYNIPFSLINDRLSFQIELIYNSINYKQEFSNLFNSKNIIKITSGTIGIPLLLKYEISRNKVSPVFAFGKEINHVFNSITTYNDEELQLNSFQKSGWFFDLGLNYKIFQNSILFTNIRVQSFNNLIIGSYGTGNQLPFYSASEHRYYNMIKTYLAVLYLGMKF